MNIIMLEVDDDNLELLVALAEEKQISYRTEINIDFEQKDWDTEYSIIMGAG